MTNHAILGLTPSQRRELFEAAERVITLRAAMIEKDFWVYWTLGQLFSLPDAREHFIFKGGTSLSKVWGAIHRFSEDIDISLSREWLGFSGERDPEGAASGNKRRQLLDDLSKACAVRLRDDVLPALRAVMMESLGASNWSLEVDSADPQTLLFAYPTALTDAPSYIRPVVKIECGARSDRWPVQMGRLVPYVADAFPEALKGEPMEVPVLGIERTFWEKATILHAEAHRRAEQPTPERYSRRWPTMMEASWHCVGTISESALWRTRRYFLQPHGRPTIRPCLVLFGSCHRRPAGRSWPRTMQPCAICFSTNPLCGRKSSKPWKNLKPESTIRSHSFHRPSDFGMKDKLLFKHFSSCEHVNP